MLFEQIWNLLRSFHIFCLFNSLGGCPVKVSLKGYVHLWMLKHVIRNEFLGSRSVVTVQSDDNLRKWKLRVEIKMSFSDEALSMMGGLQLLVLLVPVAVVLDSGQSCEQAFCHF
jgi:hypothetical protein